MTPDDKQRREIERAVNNALQRVSWEQDDRVDKIVRGTIMGIIVWKLAGPIFSFIRGCIILFLILATIGFLWWTGIGAEILANVAQHYDDYIKHEQSR